MPKKQWSDATLTHGVQLSRFFIHQFKRRMDRGRYPIAKSEEWGVSVVQDSRQPTPLDVFRVRYHGHTTATHCWYCAHRIPAETKPVPVVVRYERVRQCFVLQGQYCSYACGLADIRQSLAARPASRSMTLTRHFYRIRYGVRHRIPPAPPKTMLKKFGGDMSIEEFRALTAPVGGKSAEVVETQNLSYPLDVYHEPPRVVLFPPGPPRPPCSIKQPDTRLIRNIFWQERQQSGPTQAQRGRVVAPGPRGKRRFLCHVSRKDRLRDAEHRAGEMTRVYETLPDTCPDGERNKARDRAKRARRVADEMRETVRAATTPTIRRSKIDYASKICDFF